MDFQWRTQYHRVTSTLPAVIGVLGLFSVLMVVFLICSQRVSLPGTAIDLPRFENEELTPLVKTVVTVTADGKLFYNAKRLDTLENFKEVLQELALKYQEAQAELPERSLERRPKVVFYVDQNAPLSIVAQLFDIARGAKFDAYLATSGASLRNNKNYVPSLDENGL
ncbi:MAG: biopolymer transporter ExbD [Oligosphaeraceae bacterium]